MFKRNEKVVKAVHMSVERKLAEEVLPIENTQQLRVYHVEEKL